MNVFMPYFNKIPPSDIEEISHKAGNFKKFGVFVKMLATAFTEEKDSVLFVDLLTFADLELLKARKNGGQLPTSRSAASIEAANRAPTNKRYIILTYNGEFDRVHYPLPLLYEDPLAPNVNSLRRTIVRLRKALKSQIPLSASDDQISTNGNDKDKDKYVFNFTLLFYTLYNVYSCNRQSPSDCYTVAAGQHRTSPSPPSS